ncbi:MAG: hypothetical protein Q4C60_02045 [Eubacteriales bacterium]|nr:hypothetical protein [Eubacteriales bacterium]
MAKRERPAEAAGGRDEGRIDRTAQKAAEGKQGGAGRAQRASRGSAEAGRREERRKPGAGPPDRKGESGEQAGEDQRAAGGAGNRGEWPRGNAPQRTPGAETKEG